MADAAGDDIAVLLLRVLPVEVADLILGRMDDATAGRLRTRLRAVAASSPQAGKELDAALSQFFDLQRIAERPQPTAGEYRPVAKTETSPAPGKPVDAVRNVPPNQLAKALEGEQHGTVALVLSCLDPTAAGQVMRLMPVDARAEVALRMTKLGSRNPILLQQLIKAVIDKAHRLSEVPAEPTPEELITNLADMLRAVPRAERLPIIRKIETVDPDLAVKIMDKLYRIEDILRIPNRQMQTLLGKLDVKTIAIALSNVAEAVREKVSGNMSSRAKTALTDESELLGSLPVSRTREAQARVMALVRKGEEDGEIVMDE